MKIINHSILKRIMKMKSVLILLISCFSLMNSINAQNILFDQCIDAEGLKLCPSVYNQSDYYYLVNEIQLGKHPNGKPQFSFVKFIRESVSPTGKVEEFTETGDVAGVITALFKLEVSEDKKRQALSTLRRIRRGAKIVGQIIPKSGTVSLVSSYAKADGEKVQKVVGLGQAPIMEGSKAAVSIYLTKEGADELWATFETPTPDITFRFEMDLEGFWDRKRITVEAEWDKLYSHKDFQAAVASPILSAEIRKTLDQMKDDQTLKVDIIGEDAALEKMLDAVYNKITNLMFDKIAGTGVTDMSKLNPKQQKSMLDRATESLRYHRKETMDYNTKLAGMYKERAEFEEKVRKRAQERRDRLYKEQGRTFIPPTGDQLKKSPEEARSGSGEQPMGGSYDLPQYQSVPSFSAAVSYVMKEVRQSGRLFLDFNKRVKDIRTESFSENIGAFISKSKCKDCFKKINLFDPAYQQHVIRARMDLNSFDDFQNYVNNVDVQLRKKHKNGKMTVKGLSIDRRKFAEDNNEYIMQYGWNDDGESIEDRLKWLLYDYKVKWSFFGGHTIESDWVKDYDGASVDLVPPLYRQRIDIEVYPEELEDIRYVEVLINYKVNGKISTERKRLKLDKTEDISTSIYILQPPGKLDYEYELRWFKKGSRTPITEASTASNSGLIILDTML